MTAPGSDDRRNHHKTAPIDAESAKALLLFYELPMRSGNLQASPTATRLFCTVVISVALLSCSSGDGPEKDETKTSLTYCDAKVVIEEKCLRCHSEGGEVDTPFFLDTYEEVSERVTSLQRVIKNGSMPFMDRDLEPEVEPLTSAEKELLLEWLAADAPQGEEDCE